MQMITLLKDELSVIEDPRVVGRTRHQLIDILVLGILAVICHAETWEEMEDFGYAKMEWLKKFLDLPNGIPSHDTISRVFSLIEPKELEFAFSEWVLKIQVSNKNRTKDTICLDGKSVHGTTTSGMGQGRSCLHLVSAWSTKQGLVLGQVKSQGRGHSESSAALELLDLIDIENMVIVADAGIGRISVCNKIKEKKADYIFPIKANSKKYFDQIKEAFEENEVKLDSYRTEEAHHGRVEIRTAYVIRKKDFPFDLNEVKDHFPGLQAVGKIVYERLFPETAPFIYNNGKRKMTDLPIREETQSRFFFTSLNLSTKGLMEKLRSQWGIENQLHWSLDVQLGEDANRTRNKIAAQNLCVARKIALNLVKQDPSRQGLKSKLKKAGWDLDYLENLLLSSKLS